MARSKLVRRYALGLGLKIGVHALRATAATNALDHDADIAKVQEWLGHANIATTRIYDRRRSKVEDSPTFTVSEEKHTGRRLTLEVVRETTAVQQ
jgi:integrase/recombinase XerD